MRGSTAISGFQNTNEVGSGIVKALTIDDTPKIRPTAAPTIGPSKIAAMITGMCIVVAFIIPSGMKPSGVNPSTMVIAPSIAEITNLRIFSLFILFSFRIRSVCGIAPRQNYTANTIKNPQDSKKNVIKLEKIFKFPLISAYNLLKLKVL